MQNIYLGEDLTPNVLEEPWILNIGVHDFKRANHPDPGNNTVLIQILDTCSIFPVSPRYNFAEIHQFEFLDIDDPIGTDLPPECLCTHAVANQLVQILNRALVNRHNVLVHCFAGVCRSGAVVEVGVAMGFTDPKVFRQPNLLVEGLMMDCLMGR